MTDPIAVLYAEKTRLTNRAVSEKADVKAAEKSLEEAQKALETTEIEISAIKIAISHLESLDTATV